MRNDEDDPDGGTAPCFADALIDGHVVDPDTARDVARFRRAERARLLELRKMPVAARDSANAALVAALDRVVTPAPGLAIAVYWPIRGEPDLRGWMADAHAAGADILLPVVETRDAPLVFRRWEPDTKMTRGFWNIPVPADAPAGQPDTVIAPLLGIDAELYRLGNGGGYYDRTLAALAPRPRAIGVGFAGCRLPTIYPMPWDVPMQAAVLSDGTVLER